MALNDRPQDWFLFFLGDQLGKTVAEIQQMTLVELSGWKQYYQGLAKKKGNKWRKR